MNGGATVIWNIALSECFQVVAVPDTPGGAKYICEVGSLSASGAHLAVSYVSGSTGNRLIHWICVGAQ